MEGRSRQALTALFLFFLVASAKAISLPQVEVWQTAQSTGDRLTRKPNLVFGSEFSSQSTVTLNTTITFQAIQGFGGAFTEASAYNFYKMSPAIQQEILEAYYGKSGIGYTIGRIHMNSCDFSLGNYNFDNVTGDYKLEHFDIAHDREQLIPFIKSALATNDKEMRLFITPWSPPAWMKSNNAMDNSLVPGLIQDPQIFASWALYYSKFITEYESSGIPIWGLTVQNEPENSAIWESCRYTADQEAEFVAKYLGPQMKQDHPSVKIMIFDHNKDDVYAYASTILSNPEAAAYIWGTAFHWYAGPGLYSEHLDALNTQFPDYPLFASEACECPGVILDSWSRGEDYGFDIIADLNHHSVSWTDWNLVLDMQGGPNHVGNYCDAPIIVDADAQAVHYQITFYYMAQISKFVVPGSVRIAADFVNAPANVSSVAFWTPENEIVFIAMNTNEVDTVFKLSFADYATEVSVPAHGIVTLKWLNFAPGCTTSC